MTNRREQHLEANKWHVTHLRATTFVRTSYMEEEIRDVWGTVFDGRPDEEHIIYNQGVKVQKGAYNNNLLTVDSRPNRVDWLITPPPRPDEPPKLLTVGCLSDVLNSLLIIIERWLSVCPKVNRLALGTFLARAVTDEHAGYEEILQFLPNVRLEYPGVTDFLYQINRSRTSTSSADVRINRLSKWSVVRADATLRPPDSPLVAMSTNEQGQYYCTLELDINTVPSAEKDISQRLAYPIFAEAGRVRI